MRGLCVWLAVIGWCGVAAGQLTPEEAYQKLKEKQKQHAAGPASQPVEGNAPAARVPGGGIAEGRLVHDGWTALTGRRYADGVSLFDKAIGLDASDPVALQGRGICKYELKDYKGADKDLLKAYNLSSAAGLARVPRQLVIAYAGASLMSDNPMRGVKALRATMDALSANGTFDEELQNDLGISLSHANPTARRLALFEDALKFYADYDKQLNDHKKDGTARWGDKWVDKPSAEKKWKDYKEDAKELEQTASNYQHCVLARQHAYDNYLELKGGLRLHSDAEAYRFTTEYKEALLTEAAAKRQMEKSEKKLAGVDKPPFPDRIDHDWTEPR
ncbi:MAG TPA: hypothetical protein VLJ39_00660 [Tepidisphaeraceae bacterium]|nr:hypothetical protein [Tepidisphaeraceae bacterium]